MFSNMATGKLLGFVSIVAGALQWIGLWPIAINALWTWFKFEKFDASNSPTISQQGAYFFIGLSTAAILCGFVALRLVRATGNPKYVFLSCMGIGLLITGVLVFVGLAALSFISVKPI